MVVTGLRWAAVLALVQRVAAAPAAASRFIPSYAGPYAIWVRSWEDCPSREVPSSGRDLSIASIMHHARSSKDNKDTLFMDVNMTAGKDFFARRKTNMTLDVALWNAVSGWREHFLVMPLGDACFVYDDMASEIVKGYSSRLGTPAKCPVPSGVYRGFDIPAKVGRLRFFPALPYGRFRVHTLYHHGPSPGAGPPRTGLRACSRMVVDISPSSDNAPA